MARSAIFARRAGEHRRQLRIAELLAKQLTGAVYAAGGAKDPQKHADAVSFFPDSRKPRRVIRTEQAVSRFGAPAWGESGGS